MAVCLVTGFFAGRFSVRILPVRGVRREGSSASAAADEDPQEPRPDNIYGQIRYLFEEDRLFLNPDLDEGMLARRLHTNRSYVSEAIKKNKGWNYPYYVNNYRIRYAMRVFFEDPSIRVGELARLCGYKQPATFSTAFHSQIGISPSTWMQMQRDKMHLRCTGESQEESP